jgi:hypothetical protein
MDHDSKDGAAGDDRRNWRERLGVGQDLPKISDEFEPARTPSDAKPSEREPTGPQSATKPGTPVARPAPMAPRYARPAAPKPANGSSSSEGTNGANHSQTARSDPAAPGLNAWAAPSRPARGPHQDSDHHSGHEGRAPSSTPSPASNTPSAPSRASAYPQAARPSGAAPASSGESFGERLRAQREAAEKLAQQRVAAARERSLRASADALTILAPHKAEARISGNPAAKPAGGDQPRFTFAQEEIVAARQETSFAPGPAADPAPKMDAPVTPDDGVRRAAPPAPDRPAPDRRAPDEPKLYSEPHRHAAGAPEYRHEDDAIFQDESTFEEAQPTLKAAPPRASAADYSAAYREFEDEFEEEPRRRSGPLLLLASLAALAVISGGAIYLYQQGSGQQVERAPPAAAAANVPVIAAPAEPAKADPPAQEPLQAAAPTTRKEIYDRIIGEETLEPERIVPTEEAPLRQIQQPRATEAGGENQSGEPLPLPLPPPPGTGIGEQGDLLVPGAADIQRASAEPDPQPEPEPELSFPEPREAAYPGRRPADRGTSLAAAPRPDSRPDGGPDTGNVAPAEAAASAAAKLRGTAAVAETPAPVPSRPSIYPEVTEPLAYPRIRTVTSPSQDQFGGPEPRDTLQAEQDAEAETALVTERMTAPAAEAEADQVAEPQPVVAEAEAELAEAEPAGEPTSDVPLPKAKPEPPVRVAAAPQPAPQPQAPQPQPQAAAPAGSGPVQIIPTDQSQAPIARAAQPEAQSAPPRRRAVGREPDPLAGPGSTFASSLSESLNIAPSQQVASVAPDASTQLQPPPSQPVQTDPAGEYLVQLASFRSEAEALSAYQQLAQRHPQLVGNLGSRVREASLGQTGSFWRLGVGPLSNRTEATRLCNALIAAGEKDCLVRRN